MSEKNSTSSDRPAKQPAPAPPPEPKPAPKVFERPVYVTIEKGWRPDPEHINIGGGRENK